MVLGSICSAIEAASQGCQSFSTSSRTSSRSLNPCIFKSLCRLARGSSRAAQAFLSVVPQKGRFSLFNHPLEAIGT